LLEKIVKNIGNNNNNSSHDDDENMIEFGQNSFVAGAHFMSLYNKFFRGLNFVAG